MKKRDPTLLQHILGYRGAGVHSDKRKEVDVPNAYITVSVTPYGEQGFSEAVHWSSYVEDRVGQYLDRQGIDGEIRISEGNRVSVSISGPKNVIAMEDELEYLINTEFWFDFCSEGYKQYVGL